MTTAKIIPRVEYLFCEPVRGGGTRRVRVLASVDGFAMVQPTHGDIRPFVVYQSELRDIKESFTDMMVKAGREG